MTTQHEHVELICCAGPRANCKRLPSRPGTWLVGLLLLLCAAGAQAAPAFPVKHSADKRYLVDQTGTPFPILGRTAWFVVSLPETDYKTFIDDTVARGYTAIEFHVINHDPRGNRPPLNGNGDAPFLKRLNGTAWDGTLSYGNINTDAPDFTTPNEAYWRFVDGLLTYCESKGVLVFMFPAYVGWSGGDMGWMQEMVANGSSRMRSYGAWIAARYANQKNLVWMMGGDMGSFNSDQLSAEDGLLAGLKSVAGQQSTLFSAEWSGETIATDQATFGSSMTLNGAYSGAGDVNTHGRRAYGHSPVVPAFLLEEPYDQEGSDGNGYNPSATQPVRRFQWWGWLSTIGGYISGNGYVWLFRAPDWRNHLDTQGSRDMARLNAFIVSIPWYSLVPSGLGGMRTLITAGGGSAVNASDYVAASATPQGTFLVAYIPPAHSGSITVDMGAMGGPSRARWFDPTSGAYTSIGSGLANSGTREFTPPGNNSVGQTDWTLVLDTASGSASQSEPAPPPARGMINIGETTVLSTADNGNGNLLVTQQATLPVTSVLQSISFYVTNAAGKLRLGVYDSTGPSGGPGKKLAETAEITPVVGWNSSPVVSQVTLQPGSYWLSYFPSSNSLALRKNLTGQGAYYTQNYGVMPATFSTFPTKENVHWSLYATLSNTTPTPTATPTPTPGMINIGETTVLSIDDNGNGNLLVAQQATLPVTSVLQSMSFYVTNAAGKLRLGVYDASGPGGGPGNKVAETAEISPVNGWNRATTSPTVLARGTYWLAYFPSSNSLAFFKNPNGTGGRFYSLPYGPLPSKFSTTPSDTQSHWSFYATLQL